MEKGGHIQLGDLDVYKCSVDYGREAWKIFEKMSWDIKKNIGNQFIESVDSVGANIAEGYGRFHYKDRGKFYYNARGSLFETKHWLLLLKERNIISKEQFDSLLDLANTLHKKLNIYIKSCKENNI